VSLVQQRELVNAVRDLVQAVRSWRDQEASSRMRTSPGITRVRTNQRQFLKANQKFPDYIEVGADVWDELVDWHVSTLRTPTITVRPDGRYQMAFLQTTVILRVDFGDEQVGLGFDTRPAP
jgi:hypothetical protein